MSDLMGNIGVADLLNGAFGATPTQPAPIPPPIPEPIIQPPPKPKKIEIPADTAARVQTMIYGNGQIAQPPKGDMSKTGTAPAMEPPRWGSTQ